MNDSTDSAPISSKVRKTRTPKTLYKYPVVVVTWDDAESDPSWFNEPTEDLKPTIATTIGFLIRDNAHEDRMLVADSYIDDAHNTISNSVKIPKGMIKEIRYLIKNGYRKV